MECCFCGDWALVACRVCKRAICDRHRVGLECKDKRECDLVTGKISMPQLYAPFGNCPKCKLPLVKGNEEPPFSPPHCPVDGYVTVSRPP